MSGKYALEKEGIETLKRAIEILDDINCDEYADNIREILEEEVKDDTGYISSDMKFNAFKQTVTTAY